MPAGRPKGSTNKAKEVKEETKQEINLEEIIAKAVSIALDKKDKEHKEEIERIKKQHSVKDEDIQVEVMNNTSGIFVIGGDKGKLANVFFKLYECGDMAPMDYNEFRAYYAQNSGFFKSGELIIKNVIGMEFDKFVSKIGIAELYAGDITVADMDTILEAEYNMFEAFMDKNPRLMVAIMEYATRAYKNGKFNYGDKQNYFRNKFGDNKLFTK